MCGIVGIHLKNPELRPRLGAIFSPMLMEMSERGPDSSGVAVYRETDDWVAMALGVPGACAPAGRWRELRSRADAGAGPRRARRSLRNEACVDERPTPHPGLRDLSAPRHCRDPARRCAEGIYSIRGAGAKRPVPDFDDLVFLGASVSCYPLEGYREACATNVTVGTRFASKPIELAIPVTIAGMSFGALGANAKRALGLAASRHGNQHHHR